MVGVALRFTGRRRLPLVLQTEAAECGLAALAMAAGFHGLDIDLPTLRRRHQTTLKGMTLADMVRIADALELASRALRLEPDEMVRLALPCILHWDMNHFVVLARVDRHGIVIHDPASGRRRVKWGDVSRSFTGVALELAPTPQFAPRRERHDLPWRSFLTGIGQWRPALLQVFLLGLVLEVLSLTAPLFTQWMVDGVLPAADRDLLKVLVVGALLVALSQGAVSALRAWLLTMVSAALGVAWQSRMFSHLLHLPVAFFERRFIGDIASRFHGVATIQQTLTGYFIEALLDGLLAVGTFALMLVYSPGLTAIALGVLALYALLRWLWYGALREINEQQLVLAARRDSHFLETLRGIQAIKLFQRQAARRSAWLNLLVEETNTAIRGNRLDLAYRAGNLLLTGLEQAAVLWFGASLVLENRFSVGMYMAFAAYNVQFAARMAALIDKAVALRMLRLQTERLADIALTAAEPPPGDSAEAVQDASVEFRNVWFRYGDGEPWVCRALSFRVAAGESVALAGPSGCGKTTVLKLLLGVLPPTRGDILVGGVPLARLGVQRVRELCACVMQDDQLFAGSMRDNIVFFDPQPDEARAERCARIASIHDTIAAMPMGYHTLVGDMGATLSGGQRQRLLLARALYKQPAILVLDEATSSLDGMLEGQVNRAVAALCLTRLIVAHRPDTLRSADRVVTLTVPPADDY